MNASAIKAVALDYGGTISLDRIDHLIGQKPVDPAAAAALRILHDDLEMRLVLGSNTSRTRPAGPRSSRPGSTACSLRLSSPTRSA